MIYSGGVQSPTLFGYTDMLYDAKKSLFFYYPDDDDNVAVSSSKEIGLNLLDFVYILPSFVR